MIPQMSLFCADRLRHAPGFCGWGLLCGMGLAISLACTGPGAAPDAAKSPAKASAEKKLTSASKPAKPAPDAKVGYDLRVSRPGEKPLQEVYDRHLNQAKAANKRLAVLFSAEWCKACGELDLELGNQHAAARIGDVRILKLVEEEWKAVARLDEYNALRSRWVDEMWSYPLLVLLDGEGKAIEDMAAAKDRFEANGVEANLPDWFDDLRGRGWKLP